MFLFMPLFYHCGTKRKTVKHALAQRSTAGKLYTFLVIFTSVALKNKQTVFLDKKRKSFTMVGKMTYPRPL